MRIPAYLADVAASMRPRAREDGGEMIADALGHFLPDTREVNLGERQPGEARGAETAHAKLDAPALDKASKEDAEPGAHSRAQAAAMTAQDWARRVAGVIAGARKEGGPLVSVAPPQETPAPYAPMLAANAPAPMSVAPPPASPPAAEPAPFPGMLAKPAAVSYTPAQEARIREAGFSPEQAAAAGFKFPEEPSEPLKTSGQRMNEAIAAKQAAAAPPAGPPAAGSEPQAAAFPLIPISGGGSAVIPAHETELRGPTLIKQQERELAAAQGAIDAARERNAATAAASAELARGQAQALYAHQDAQAESAVERANELAARQQDFDATVKQLASFRADPNRFWASRTTGQRVALVASMALGGFLQGVHGGSNPALDAINQSIDRDLRAQELNYSALRDTANAKQTAFSMAMQKYGSVDAARAAAKASMLDAMQAQIREQAANSQNAEAQNRADAMLAQLEGAKTQMIQQGIAFSPARTVSTGPKFIDPATGLVYSEQEAKAISGQIRSTGLETAKGLMLEAGKAAAAGNEEAKYGPLGKAGTQKMALEQAQTQRELDANQTAISKAQSHVKEIVEGTKAGAIASELPAWVPGVTSARKNMTEREAYNTRVMVAIGAAYKLGTDAMEPKNRALIEEYAKPYKVTPSDNEEAALYKMKALGKFLSESAASKGAETPGAPASFQPKGAP